MLSIIITNYKEVFILVNNIKLLFLIFSGIIIYLS